jgi:two-component system response regulator VicR
MLNDRFLTTGDVADYCQVSRSSVFRWIREGKLEAFTTPGGHYRVPENEFRNFLARYGIPIYQEYFDGGHDVLE